MNVQLKRLTYERINQSQEIQTWLKPFGEKRSTAIEMLLRLRFVSRDTYAEWLKATIENIREEKIALFAVRKLSAEIESLWDEQGQFLFRPPESLGSEDLVQSVIANLTKNNSNTIFDHPDLQPLREQRVHQFVLVDDSIGSGKRVKDYLKRLFNHKTIRSWWSFGKFTIVVIAFARVHDSAESILKGIPGSNHGIRVHPKNKKVRFVGHLSYAKDNLLERWGPMFHQILQLCKYEDRVPRDRRRGFGNIMANTVFYHSVPNNLPGVLWFQSDHWDALFPKRSVPIWLPELLDDQYGVRRSEAEASSVEPNEEMVLLLRLAKQGIRTENSLAWHLGLDPHVVRKLTFQMREKKLLTAQNRITEAGRRFLSQRVPTEPIEFDYGLYVPQTWCADREPVQPSGVGRESVLLQTESDVGLPMSDGKVGQTFLEKTDAKTAKPSLGIMPELPSDSSRDGHDAHGPSGPKES